MKMLKSRLTLVCLGILSAAMMLQLAAVADTGGGSVPVSGGGGDASCSLNCKSDQSCSFGPIGCEHCTGYAGGDKPGICGN